MTRTKSIQAAMREAMTRGVDPYNSHTRQAEVMARRWRMEAGREAKREAEVRSEMEANRYLSVFLRPQAE